LFGDIQAWDPTATYMYSFVSGIYEIISYTLPGLHSYRFLNGNDVGTSETVPDSCNLGGSRTFDLVDHTVLNTVCFSSCTQCEVAISVDDFSPDKMSIFPNPMTDRTIIQVVTANNSFVRISDASGKLIFSKSMNNRIELNGHDFSSGIYCVQMMSSNGSQMAISKLVVE
jgi:Secretion system C-terminal sorting domain